ncbi:MAG: ADP-dependent glucokinase/phosphofructokinase [Spirochaetota bacterium]
MEYDHQVQTFFCGLTNNLDLVIHLSPDRLTELAWKFGDRTIEGSADSRIISTIPECIALLIEYMRKGAGGEISFTGEDIPQFIEEYFVTTPALGGTGMRAAELISLGNSECLVHLPYLDHQVATLLEPMDLDIVHDDSVTKAQDSATLTEQKESPSNRRPNYIFQYPAQSSFSVFGEPIETPYGNRIILTQYSKPERSLPLFPAFFNSFRDCERPATLLLSGYNAVRDRTTLTKRLQETVEYIQAPMGGEKTVVLEMGGFSRTSFFFETVQTLAPHVNFISMNGEELQEITHWLNIDQQAESPIANGHALSLECAIDNLIIHTHQYSFCLCDASSYNTENIRTGLHKANSIAGAIASGREVSSLPSLLQYGEELKYNKTGQQFFLKYDHTSLGDKEIVCAPARNCDSLVRTVGLGDAFIGSFMLFGT